MALTPPPTIERLLEHPVETLRDTRAKLESAKAACIEELPRLRKRAWVPRFLGLVNLAIACHAFASITENFVGGVLFSAGLMNLGAMALIVIPSERKIHECRELIEHVQLFVDRIDAALNKKKGLMS